MDGPRGPLPPGILGLLRNGAAELRAPASLKLAVLAESLAKGGALDAEFEMHARARRWAVTMLKAPEHTGHVRRLDTLREEATRAVPDAASWIRNATEADLDLALAVTAVPNWRKLGWPARIWTSLLRGTSKEGDVSRVVQALGGRTSQRGHALWFYGNGVLHTAARSFTIAGEECITSSHLTDLTGVTADEIRVIENRDLASIITDGLVLAVDGNPKPAHLAIMQAARNANIPCRAWFDMDAEGVRMARLVSEIQGVTIEGFAAYPLEWGISLQEEPEKLRILRMELETPGRFDDVLAYLKASNQYWEQERIFAEMTLKGTTLAQFAAQSPFPGFNRALKTSPA